MVQSAPAGNAQTRKIWLSSLDLSKVSYTAKGHYALRAGMNIAGQQIMIAGRLFNDGIGVCAHSYMYIDLKKSCDVFRSFIGVDDAVTDKKVAVKFQIFGDSRELFKSGYIKPGEQAREIVIDTRGVDQLILIAKHLGETFSPHFADWADAQFEVSGKFDPAVVRPPLENAVLRTPKAKPAPNINGPKIIGVRPGSPFLFRVPVTGDRPMKFAADKLPEGLELDAKKGIIKGVLKSSDKFNFIISAANDKGTAQRQYTIVVGDEIALTPPMGWNSWYVFAYKINDEKMRAAADAMINSGMADYGYSYVNSDEAWQAKPGIDEPFLYEGVWDKEAMRTYWKSLEKTPTSKPNQSIRDENGAFLPDAKFPSMNALTDYIHSLGLKAGIYSSPGPISCGGYTGSFLHEVQDAKQIADWGFDFLKYDWCSYKHAQADINTLHGKIRPFERMGMALKAQKRDIVFNLCQYGIGDVWKWAAEIGGHCWRVDIDLGWETKGYAIYCGILTLCLPMDKIAQYNGPGHWNDPDYIMIGNKDGGIFEVSPEEQYSYMTLWALWASPLFYSGDLTRMDEFTLNVLCNSEVLAVNQDSLGNQAKLIYSDDDRQIWAKDLEDGSKAVGLLNTGEFETTVTLNWKDIGFDGPRQIRDLWRHKNLGTFDKNYAVAIPRHSAEMIKLMTQV